MRILPIACFVLLSLASLPNVFGQGFVNLDFEQSTILTASPSRSGPWNVGSASVPGWTMNPSFGPGGNYSGGTTMWYNNPTLDAPGITLVTANFPNFPAIDGRFSILLEGGDTPLATDAPSIGQTGQIPITAQSLRFLVYYNSYLQITFNGHILPFYTLENDAGYSVLGADISAYAGQTGQLLFTKPVLSGESVIDDIFFTPDPIPEPSVLRLSSACILLLYWRVRKQLGRQACRYTAKAT